MATHFEGPVLTKNNPERGGTRSWYSNLPSSEDPNYTVYYNDFSVGQDYAAADWLNTTTEAGAGSATEALELDERGGALLITNDDADNDAVSLQHSNDGGTTASEQWSLTAGKKLWFDCRFKVSDADTEDAFIGLCIKDTTPLAATDRVGIQITTTDASIDVTTEKDSTETLTDTGEDLVDDTYSRCSFYYDGVSRVYFYVDGSLKATHSTNVPDDENLTITVHHQNGDAVADTMSIDYIYVAQER